MLLEIVLLIQMGQWADLSLLWFIHPVDISSLFSKDSYLQTQEKKLLEHSPAE